MSISRKPIGIVTLNPPIEIDEEKLKKAFPNLEISEDQLKVPVVKRRKFEFSLELDTAGLLLAKKTEKGFSQFASVLSMDELTQLINEIPNDQSDLRNQLDSLLKRLEEIHANWTLTDAQEQSLFQKYIAQLNQTGTTVLHSKEINFLRYASEEELRKAAIVVEHSYLIKSFAGFDANFSGTYALGSCILLVAINFDLKKVGVTHLDEATIEKYRNSMEHLFNTLQSGNNKTAVYLLGGIDSNAVSSLGDMRYSKTLVYSIQEFLKNRPDCYLAGTFLFKKEKNASAYVVMLVGTANEPVFLRVDNKYEMLLTDKAKQLLEDNQVLGSAIYHRELVLLEEEKPKSQLALSGFRSENRVQQETKEEGEEKEQYKTGQEVLDKKHH